MFSLLSDPKAAVVAALALPYMSVIIARLGRSGYDIQDPRPYVAKLTGWRARAHAAQSNGFEVFPPFAVAVLWALWQQHDPAMVACWAWAFVGFRVLYTGFYWAHWGICRALCFFAAFYCMIHLFLL